jgi:hypothetical protein
MDEAAFMAGIASLAFQRSNRKDAAYWAYPPAQRHRSIHEKQQPPQTPIPLTDKG